MAEQSANEDAQMEMHGNVDDELLKYIEEHLKNPNKYNKIIDYVKRIILDPEEWFFRHLPLQVNPHPCMAEYSVEAIGSTSEQLAVTETSESGYNEELDFTLVLKTLTATHDTNACAKENMAEILYSDEFPGHVYLKIHDSETASKWNGLCNIISNEQGDINEFFLAPEAITDEFYMMMCYRKSIENWSRYLKYLKGSHENEIDVDSLKTDESEKTGQKSELSPADESLQHSYMLAQEGPAVKTTLFLHRGMISLQFDRALAIPCVEWPNIAEQWIDRKRHSGWPTKRLIQDITSKGCLLVPKCPSLSRTNLEWRISFCLTERSLMTHLKEEQKICYILLKGIWRQFLKPPSGKALQSYHLKNVLLWECEEIQKEHWTLDRTATRVIGLLLRLKGYIEAGHCPHYIVPENNLFQDIDIDVLRRTGERVGISITEAKVTWIQNTALFSLPHEKTRLGMHKEMIDIYASLVKEICKCKANTERKADFMDLSFLEKTSLDTTLNQLLWPTEVNFIINILKTAMSPNEAGLIRRYICTRASPKQLHLAAADGMLEFIACIVSGLTALSELTEIVTELEILKTQNFEEYGFSKSYRFEEMFRLIAKYLKEWSLNNGTVLHEDHILNLFIDMKEMLPSTNDEDTEDLVEDVIDCDGCNKEVTSEVHYHCEVCPDFDLCESCFEANSEHNHKFSLINEEM